MGRSLVTCGVKVRVVAERRGVRSPRTVCALHACGDVQSDADRVG